MASSGFEAVALKKLRDLLQEKGYTPEMIFSNFIDLMERFISMSISSPKFIKPSLLAL
mgnify:CR=1 FL=1